MSRCIELLPFATLLLVAGCTPAASAPETISIARLKSLYRGVPTALTDDIRFEATVVSSDQYRNFAETVCLEDSTGGIAVSVEGDALYRKYPVGAIVAVSCAGLWLGSYGDEVRLGDRPEGDREYSPMDAATAALHIVRTDRAAEPVPTETTIGALTWRHTGCYICLRGVRFTEQGVGWYDETSLGRRYLTDAHADTLEVFTRAEALFGSLPLPEGEGTIRGIISCFAGRCSLHVNNEFDNEFE